ncbi:MAG: MaoC/PaaZ C-terminal domain-containing protein, partial [Acidimicrobiia bacterium]
MSAAIAIGDTAPQLVVENLTRTNFVRYAGASGDLNPMHHDDTIATQVGNPSVFGHGMLTAGLMARVVKDWLGPEALRRIQV